VKIFAILLVVAGLLAMVAPSISFTREQTLLEVGPLELTTKKRESLSVWPMLGMTLMAAGAAIFLAAAITGKK
jgi:uncharacterized protein YjeT (DUF2065 family)